MQKEAVTIKLNYYDLIFLDSLKKTTKTLVSTTTLWLEFKLGTFQISSRLQTHLTKIFSVGYSKKNSMLIQNMKQCKCTA
jgi:hypothetical protein